LKYDIPSSKAKNLVADFRSSLVSYSCPSLQHTGMKKVVGAEIDILCKADDH